MGRAHRALETDHLLRERWSWSTDHLILGDKATGGKRQKEQDCEPTRHVSEPRCVAPRTGPLQYLLPAQPCCRTEAVERELRSLLPVAQIPPSCPGRQAPWATYSRFRWAQSLSREVHLSPLTIQELRAALSPTTSTLLWGCKWIWITANICGPKRKGDGEQALHHGLSNLLFLSSLPGPPGIFQPARSAQR